LRSHPAVVAASMTDTWDFPMPDVSRTRNYIVLAIMRVPNTTH
jgi:hypothetical protein